MLAYQFAFGRDDRLYTIAFKGMLSELEIRKMLEILQKYLYQNFGEAIHFFLDKHKFPYMDFASSASVLEHSSAMASADGLLHVAYGKDAYGPDGNADIFYAVMDHQKQISSNYCEGCYYAVMRAAGRQGEKDTCHIVVQTFGYEESGCTEQACFVNRTGDGNGQIYDIESLSGEPVLPTFGIWQCRYGRHLDKYKADTNSWAGSGNCGGFPIIIRHTALTQSLPDKKMDPRLPYRSCLCRKIYRKQMAQANTGLGHLADAAKKDIHLSDVRNLFPYLASKLHTFGYGHLRSSHYKKQCPSTCKTRHHFRLGIRSRLIIKPGITLSQKLNAGQTQNQASL